MKTLYAIVIACAFLASNTTFAQLSGTFTVGTPTSDYPTLTAAGAALTTSGVGAGGVILDIAPGIYQENVVLGNIAGLSATSPLIIQAVPGTVTFEGTGTTSSSNTVFLVNALSWVTIDGINIRDISTPGNDAEFGIRFWGTTTAGCQNNTIRNCDMTMGPGGLRPSSSSRGIVFTSRASSPAAANNNNVIDNVTVNNASWGIQFSCSADFFGRIAHPDFNNQVINSTFGATLPLGHDFSSGALGINALGGRNMLIENNTIAAISNLNSTPTIPVTTSGISLDSCSGIVRNNVIGNIEYQGTPGSVFGIRSSTFLGDETLIANNSISDLRRSNFTASTTDPSLSITGIWVFSQSGNNGLARVLHNSIFLEADMVMSYNSGGVNLVGGSTGAFPAEVFNNIIVNNISTSSAVYRSTALVDGNTARGFLISDNNILFANGANGFLGGIGSELGGSPQFSNDLNAFRTFSATNLNSANFLPQFSNTAAGDLSFPVGLSNQSSYLVPALALVPNDILDTVRFTPNTFAGAFESPEPLSINDERIINIALFPNPAQDVLNLTNGSGGTLDKVQVYSMMGSLLLELNANQLNSGDVQIPISNLTNGIYLIQVTGSEGRNTQKFVKI